MPKGWKWVEVRPDFGFEDQAEFERRFPESIPLLPEQQQELDTLSAEYDELIDLDDLTDEQQQRFDTVSERIEELSERDDVWTDEVKAIAGAIVSLGSDGEADI